MGILGYTCGVIRACRAKNENVGLVAYEGSWA